MNKLTIGLITAGMINCLIIGWVACSQTHEEHLCPNIPSLKHSP